jgi:Ca2+-binding RTX toxin-like protein
MAVTTQMRTQVTQLYVSLFGRAPEASGLGYWVQQLGEGKSLQTIAQDMFNVAPSRVYYPSYLTNEEIVAKFYVNVLGRTPDAGGLAYWTGRLNTESTTGTAASKMNAVGTVVTELLTAVVGYNGTDAAALASQSLLNNKVAVGLHYAVDLGGNDVAFASTLMPLVTAGSNGANLALATVDGTQSFTLTNGIDVKSANVFTANPVYTPGGNDFINSLQDEDQLTGVGINPTLNTTLGQPNDAAEGMISPMLSNIQTVNVEVTGTAGIDFQDATGVKNLNINRITATNSTTTMTDLDKSTTDISVSNATRGGTVNFLYKEDNLFANDNTLNVTLSNTRLSALTIGETGDDAGEDKGYGFETVNVTVAKASNIDNFTIGDNKREDVSTANASQAVNIVANAVTEINNLTAVGAETIKLTANADVMIAADERNILRAANDGITTTDLTKLTIDGAANVTIDGLEGNINEKATINGEKGTTLVVDASAMTGSLKLGVAVAADGNSSGVFANRTDKDVSITSGSGNDIIETYTALAGDIMTGAGDDQVLINNGATTAVWTDVEGVSKIDTGTGKDIVRARDLLATAADGNEGNQSFGEVTAASVMTGEGDDTVAVRDLASSVDTDNGVLNDSNVDDTFFIKGASVDTGTGNDTISFRTVAEGASVSAGAGADTVTVSLIGGTILAADTADKREVNLDKSANALGAIVELGSDDDTISFNTDADGSNEFVPGIPAVMNGTVVVTPAVPAIPAFGSNLNTLIVGQDAELRGGDGNDVLNVTALDVVNVTHQTTWTSKADDTNVNVTGIETANFTVLDQVNSATNVATGAAFNDNDETDGSITADIMRFDSDLKAINLVSQEKALLTTSLTEDYLAGTATSFTLNNMREGIALTLKANEATGVNGDKELQDDELTDVNLTVNMAAARGHADAFTLNIAAGSGAFDLNLNLNATATDKVGNAASKTDDDDMRVEKVTINLAADDQGHRIDFNGFGDAIHTDAPLEGSKDVATSLLVTGGSAGTDLVLDNVSADVITAAGAANVAIKLAGAANAGHNNYTITTGSGNDVINMMADNVRANNIVDDGVGEVADDDTIDGNGTIADIDEADAINAGAGDDRMIINGNDILGADVTGPTGRQLGGRTDDDVFNKIKSVESIEVQGGGSNWITLDEAAATNGANLQNIYITGAGAQNTTVQLGENFVNKSAAGVVNTLNIDSTMDLSEVKGEVAKDASLVLTIDNQDSDQDTDLVNLNIKVGMDNGTDVNFHNTGDSAAMVTLTAIVAKNTANTVAAGLAATAGNLSIDVTTGSIDKVVLIDSANNTKLGDQPDNGTITVNVSDAWAKTTFEFDASGIANQDAGKVENPQSAGVRETEGAGLTAATAAAQVAGIQAGDTGGLIFNGATELDAKLIVKGTQNDDVITGSNQDDTLSGNDGDDIINGGNGNDSISGGNGNDDIRAGIGNDTVDAGAGDDMIFGDQGADTLTGGAGKDTFTYTNVLQSNGGNFDTITDFVSADDTIVINAVVKGLDDATVASVDFINLATFKEVSSAGGGDNSLAGNTAAADRVLGDAYYATDSGEFVIDVDGNGDITTGSDLVIKSTGKITAANVNYTINAGAGNDFIRGGQGADSLDGGAGADTFVFVGTLSDAEASAYSAAFTAAETLTVGTGAAAVLGAQLTAAGVESKVLASGDLFAARTASEVNKGDKINVFGADATDKLHVFGTADLSLVNSAAALNVGTLIVHSAVTLSNAQAIALTRIVFDGNDPHTVTLKDDPNALVTSDNVNSILAKLAFLNAGPLSTFTINAPDGVLKAAWSTTNGRMEVVSDTRLVPVAAGTPFTGLGGGSVDLTAPTYANAVVKYDLGITGYAISDLAANIAGGVSPVLNAASTIATTDASVLASTLNTIDGLTTKVVNASATTLLTGTVADAATAVGSAGISGLTTKAVTISDASLNAAGVTALNTLNGLTSGVINAGSVATISGPAALVATVLAANTAGEISGLGNKPVTLDAGTAAATDLSLVNTHSSVLVNALAITTITGTAADVKAAINTQLTLDTAANVAITLSGVAAALDVNSVTGITNFTTGAINANAVTEFTGTASALVGMFAYGPLTNSTGSLITVSDAAGGAYTNATDLTALNPESTLTVNANAVTRVTGTDAEVIALFGGPGLTLTNLVNYYVTSDISGKVAATQLTAINTFSDLVIDATSIGIITGTAAQILAATTIQSEIDTQNGVVLEVTGAVTALQLTALLAVTNISIDLTLVTSITGTAAELAAVVATSPVGVDFSVGTGGYTVSITGAFPVAATLLNTLDDATSGAINASAATIVTGSMLDLTTAFSNNAQPNHISGITNKLAEVTDTSVSATTLIALNALNGTGNVDVAAVTILQGNAADIAGLVGNPTIVNLGTTGVDVSVLDTSANIQAQLVTLLGNAKVDHIDSTQNGVAINLTAAQAILASNVAKLEAGDTITVVDSTSSIQTNLAALFAEAKVDNIDSSDNVTAINITAAQFLAAGNVAKLAAGDTIVAADTSANINTNLAALFAEAKVDGIDSTENAVSINVTVAQAGVAANVAKLVAGDTVNAYGTSASLSGATLAALFAEAKFDQITSTENAVAINIDVAQSLVAANMAKLQAINTVTVVDASAAINGANLVALFANTKVDNIDSTQDATSINVTAAQAIVAANAAKLAAGDLITAVDTSANINTNLAALFAEAKVDVIDSTENAVAINVTAAQALVAANVAKLVVPDTVVAVDTGANLVTNLAALLAEAKVDSFNASNDAVTLTSAQFNSVAATPKAGGTFHNSDVITLQMANGAETVNLNAANVGGAANANVKYTLGSQASAANFTDTTAGGGLNAGDTFAILSADLISGFVAGTDKVDLTAFGLTGGVTAPALFTGTGSKVSDGEYAIVQGTFAAGTFTAGAGPDTLVVWDSNATTSVSMVSVVLIGTAATVADIILV